MVCCAYGCWCRGKLECCWTGFGMLLGGSSSSWVRCGPSGPSWFSSLTKMRLFAEIYSNNALQKTREKAVESERKTRRKERAFVALFFCRRRRVFCGFLKRRGCCFGGENKDFTCSFCAAKENKCCWFYSSLTEGACSIFFGFWPRGKQREGENNSFPYSLIQNRKKREGCRIPYSVLGIDQVKEKVKDFRVLFGFWPIYTQRKSSSSWLLLWL